MPQSFETPPLVELIVELRWEPRANFIASPVVGESLPIQFLFGSKQLDDFFSRLGIQVSQFGFQRQERLAPVQSPMIKYQPVWRFSRPSKQNELIQIGPGVFTANALPPYERWGQFVPVVQEALAALLEARDTEERDIPFSSVSLRYIDAFKQNLVRGQSPRVFIEETLGFHLNIPAALAGMIEDGKTYKPSLQMQIPVKSGNAMNLTLAEGTASGEPAIIMDTTVAKVGNVAPSVQSILEALESAHGIINEMFMQVTTPIHGLMGPKS